MRLIRYVTAAVSAAVFVQATAQVNVADPAESSVSLAHEMSERLNRWLAYIDGHDTYHDFAKGASIAADRLSILRARATMSAQGTRDILELLKEGVGGRRLAQRTVHEYQASSVPLSVQGFMEQEISDLASHPISMNCVPDLRKSTLPDGTVVDAGKPLCSAPMTVLLSDGGVPEDDPVAAVRESGPAAHSVLNGVRLESHDLYASTNPRRADVVTASEQVEHLLRKHAASPAQLHLTGFLLPGDVEMGGDGKDLLLVEEAKVVEPVGERVTNVLNAPSDLTAKGSASADQSRADRRLFSWVEAGLDVGERTAVVQLLQWRGYEHPSGDDYEAYKAGIARNVNAAVRALNEWSLGKLSIAVTINDPVTIDTVPPKNGYRTASEAFLQSTEGQAADLLGNFDFVLWWLPGGFMEAGGVGVMIGQQSWYHGSYPAAFGRTVVAHEIGHNYGYNHASYGAAEYGNKMEVMGSGTAPIDNLHCAYRWFSTWLPRDRVSLVTPEGPSPSCPDCSPSGSEFTLAPYDMRREPLQVTPDTAPSQRAKAEREASLDQCVGVSLEGPDFKPLPNRAKTPGGYFREWLMLGTRSDMDPVHYRGTDKRGDLQLVTVEVGEQMELTHYIDTGLDAQNRPVGFSANGIPPGYTYIYDGDGSRDGHREEFSGPYFAIQHKESTVGWPDSILDSVDRINGDMPESAVAIEYTDQYGDGIKGHGCSLFSCQESVRERLLNAPVFDLQQTHTAVFATANVRTFVWRVVAPAGGSIGVSTCGTEALGLSTSNDIDVHVALHSDDAPPREVLGYDSPIDTRAYVTGVPCSPGAVTASASLAEHDELPTTHLEPGKLFYLTVRATPRIAGDTREHAILISRSSGRLPCPKVSSPFGVLVRQRGLVEGRPHWKAEADFSTMRWTGSAWVVTLQRRATDKPRTISMGASDSPFEAGLVCMCPEDTIADYSGSQGFCTECPANSTAPGSSRKQEVCQDDQGQQTASTARTVGSPEQPLTRAGLQPQTCLALQVSGMASDLVNGHYGLVEAPSKGSSPVYGHKVREAHLYSYMWAVASSQGSGSAISTDWYLTREPRDEASTYSTWNLPGEQLAPQTMANGSMPSVGPIAVEQQDPIALPGNYSSGGAGDIHVQCVCQDTAPADVGYGPYSDSACVCPAGTQPAVASSAVRSNADCEACPIDTFAAFEPIRPDSCVACNLNHGSMSGTSSSGSDKCDRLACGSLQITFSGEAGTAKLGFDLSGTFSLIDNPAYDVQQLWTTSDGKSIWKSTKGEWHAARSIQAVTEYLAGAREAADVYPMLACRSNAINLPDTLTTAEHGRDTNCWNRVEGPTGDGSLAGLGDSDIEMTCKGALPGYYFEADEVKSCGAAPAGSEVGHLSSPAGATSEAQCGCPPGTFEEAGACKKCAAGTFSVDVGASSCDSCPQGATSVADSTSCVCSNPLHRLNPATGQCEARTDLCDAGMPGSICRHGCEIASNAAGFLCQCPAGQAPSGPNHVCNKCPAGTYAPDDDNTECIQCPGGSTTRKEGAKSVSECQCAGNYARDPVTGRCETMPALYVSAPEIVSTSPATVAAHHLGGWYERLSIAKAAAILRSEGREDEALAAEASVPQGESGDDVVYGHNKNGVYAQQNYASMNGTYLVYESKQDGSLHAFALVHGLPSSSRGPIGTFATAPSSQGEFGFSFDGLQWEVFEPRLEQFTPVQLRAMLDCSSIGCGSHVLRDSSATDSVQQIAGLVRLAKPGSYTCQFSIRAGLAMETMMRSAHEALLGDRGDGILTTRQTTAAVPASKALYATRAALQAIEDVGALMLSSTNDPLLTTLHRQFIAPFADAMAGAIDREESAIDSMANSSALHACSSTSQLTVEQANKLLDDLHALVPHAYVCEPIQDYSALITNMVEVVADTANVIESAVRDSATDADSEACLAVQGWREYVVQSVSDIIAFSRSRQAVAAVGNPADQVASIVALCINAPEAYVQPLAGSEVGLEDCDAPGAMQAIREAIIAAEQCADVDCGANGACVEGYCECFNDYSGDKCQFAPDPCETVNCGVHGTCLRGVCYCSLGYGGRHCQINLDDAESASNGLCTPDQCNGNGDCLRGICYCHQGYFGPACDQEVSEDTIVSFDDGSTGRTVFIDSTGYIATESGTTGKLDTVGANLELHTVPADPEDENSAGDRQTLAIEVPRFRVPRYSTILSVKLRMAQSPGSTDYHMNGVAQGPAAVRLSAHVLSGQASAGLLGPQLDASGEFQLQRRGHGCGAVDWALGAWPESDGLGEVVSPDMFEAVQYAVDSDDWTIDSGLLILVQPIRGAGSRKVGTVPIEVEIRYMAPPNCTYDLDDQFGVCPDNFLFNTELKTCVRVSYPSCPTGYLNTGTGKCFTPREPIGCPNMFGTQLYWHEYYKQCLPLFERYKCSAGFGIYKPSGKPHTTCINYGEYLLEEAPTCATEEYAYVPDKQAMKRARGCVNVCKAGDYNSADGFNTTSIAARRSASSANRRSLSADGAVPSVQSTSAETGAAGKSGADSARRLNQRDANKLFEEGYFESPYSTQLGRFPTEKEAVRFPVPYAQNPEVALGPKKMGIVFVNTPTHSWDNPNSVATDLSMTKQTVETHLRSEIEKFSRALYVSSFGNTWVSEVTTLDDFTVTPQGILSQDITDWGTKANQPGMPDSIYKWYNFPMYASDLFVFNRGSSLGIKDEFLRTSFPRDPDFGEDNPNIESSDNAPDFWMLVFPPGQFDGGMNEINQWAVRADRFTMRLQSFHQNNYMREREIEAPRSRSTFRDMFVYPARSAIQGETGAQDLLPHITASAMMQTYGQMLRLPLERWYQEPHEDYDPNYHPYEWSPLTAAVGSEGVSIEESSGAAHGLGAGALVGGDFHGHSKHYLGWYNGSDLHHFVSNGSVPLCADESNACKGYVDVDLIASDAGPIAAIAAQHKLNGRDTALSLAVETMATEQYLQLQKYDSTPFEERTMHFFHLRSRDAPYDGRRDDLGWPEKQPIAGSVVTIEREELNGHVPISLNESNVYRSLYAGQSRYWNPCRLFNSIKRECTSRYKTGYLVNIQPGNVPMLDYSNPGDGLEHAVSEQFTGTKYATVPTAAELVDGTAVQTAITAAETSVQASNAATVAEALRTSSSAVPFSKVFVSPIDHATAEHPDGRGCFDDWCRTKLSPSGVIATATDISTQVSNQDALQVTLTDSDRIAWFKFETSTSQVLRFHTCAQSAVSGAAVQADISIALFTTTGEQALKWHALELDTDASEGSVASSSLCSGAAADETFRREMNAAVGETLDSETYQAVAQTYVLMIRLENHAAMGVHGLSRQLAVQIETGPALLNVDCEGTYWDVWNPAPTTLDMSTFQEIPTEYKFFFPFERVTINATKPDGSDSSWEQPPKPRFVAVNQPWVDQTKLPGQGYYVALDDSFTTKYRWYTEDNSEDSTEPTLSYLMTGSDRARCWCRAGLKAATTQDDKPACEACPAGMTSGEFESTCKCMAPLGSIVDAFGDITGCRACAKDEYLYIYANDAEPQECKKCPDGTTNTDPLNWELGIAGCAVDDGMRSSPHEEVPRPPATVPTLALGPPAPASEVGQDCPVDHYREHTSTVQGTTYGDCKQCPVSEGDFFGRRFGDKKWCQTPSCSVVRIEWAEGTEMSQFNGNWEVYEMAPHTVQFMAAPFAPDRVRNRTAMQLQAKEGELAPMFGYRQLDSEGGYRYFMYPRNTDGRWTIRLAESDDATELAKCHKIWQPPLDPVEGQFLEYPFTATATIANPCWQVASGSSQNAAHSANITCVTAAPGYYLESESTGPAGCPSYAMSPVGAVSASECANQTTAPGMTVVADGSDKGPELPWQYYQSRKSATGCEPGSEADLGCSDICVENGKCGCGAGKAYVYGSTLCEACPSGTYATLEDSYCQPCPANTDSARGSKQASDCRCSHGYMSQSIGNIPASEQYTPTSEESAAGFRCVASNRYYVHVKQAAHGHLAGWYELQTGTTLHGKPVWKQVAAHRSTGAFLAWTRRPQHDVRDGEWALLPDISDEQARYATARSVQRLPHSIPSDEWFGFDKENSKLFQPAVIAVSLTCGSHACDSNNEQTGSASMAAQGQATHAEVYIAKYSEVGNLHADDSATSMTTQWTQAVGLALGLVQQPAASAIAETPADSNQLAACHASVAETSILRDVADGLAALASSFREIGDEPMRLVAASQVETRLTAAVGVIDALHMASSWTSVGARVPVSQAACTQQAAQAQVDSARTNVLAPANLTSYVSDASGTTHLRGEFARGLTPSEWTAAPANATVEVQVAQASSRWTMLAALLGALEDTARKVDAAMQARIDAQQAIVTSESSTQGQVADAAAMLQYTGVVQALSRSLYHMAGDVKAQSESDGALVGVEAGVPCFQSAACPTNGQLAPESLQFDCFEQCDPADVGETHPVMEQLSLFSQCVSNCDNGACGVDGRCQCFDGFYGLACDKTENVCRDEQCGLRGQCSKSDNVCECDAGWAGPACDVREAGVKSDLVGEYDADLCRQSIGDCGRKGRCTVDPPGSNVVKCECFDGYYGSLCENPPGTLVETEPEGSHTTRALMMNVENGRAVIGQWTGTGILAELTSTAYLPLDGAHHLTMLMPLVDMAPGTRVAHARLHFETSSQNSNDGDITVEISAGAIARGNGTYDGLARIGGPLTLRMTCGSVDWPVPAYADFSKTVASVDISTLIEDVVRDGEAYNGAAGPDAAQSWQRFDTLVFTIKHKEGAGRRFIDVDLVKLTVEFKEPAGVAAEVAEALASNQSIPADAIEPKYTQRGCPGPQGPVVCGNDELYDFKAGQCRLAPPSPKECGTGQVLDTAQLKCVDQPADPVRKICTNNTVLNTVTNECVAQDEPYPDCFGQAYLTYNAQYDNYTCNVFTNADKGPTCPFRKLYNPATRRCETMCKSSREALLFNFGALREGTCAMLLDDVDGVDVTCPTLSEYGVFQAVDGEDLAVADAEYGFVANSSVYVQGFGPSNFTADVKASLKMAIAKVAQVQYAIVFFTELVGVRELPSKLNSSEPVVFRGFQVSFDILQQSEFEAGDVASRLASNVDPATVGVSAVESTITPARAVELLVADDLENTRSLAVPAAFSVRSSPVTTVSKVYAAGTVEAASTELQSSARVGVLNTGGNVVAFDACSMSPCGSGTCAVTMESPGYECTCSSGWDEDAKGSCTVLLPTCTDSEKNGNETDIDCGGPNCGPCSTGEICASDSDCNATIATCSAGLCTLRPSSSPTPTTSPTPSTTMSAGASVSPSTTSSATPSTTMSAGASVSPSTTSSATPSTTMSAGASVSPSATPSVSTSTSSSPAEPSTSSTPTPAVPSASSSPAPAEPTASTAPVESEAPVEPTCSDGELNGYESDIDCGNPYDDSCPACTQGRACVGTPNCDGELICADATRTCTAPTRPAGTYVKMEALAITGVSPQQFVASLQEPFKASIYNRTGAEEVTINRVTAASSNRRVLARSRQLQAAGAGVEVDFSVRMPATASTTAVQSALQAYVAAPSSSGSGTGGGATGSLFDDLVAAAPAELRSSIAVDASSVTVATETLLTEEVVAEAPPMPTPSPSPLAVGTEGDGDDDDSWTAGGIAMVAVGVAFIVAVVAAFYLFARRSRAQRSEVIKQAQDKQPGVASAAGGDHGEADRSEVRKAAMV